MFEQKLEQPVKSKVQKVETGIFSTPDTLMLPWEDLNREFYSEIEQKLTNWTEQQGNLFTIHLGDAVVCLGWEVELQDGQTVIYDWNELSEMGLLYAVNAVVCHPKGLAIARNPNTGISPCIIVDNVEGKWDFSEKDHEDGRARLVRFGFSIPELASN